MLTWLTGYTCIRGVIRSVFIKKCVGQSVQSLNGCACLPGRPAVPSLPSTPVKNTCVLVFRKEDGEIVLSDYFP